MNNFVLKTIPLKQCGEKLLTHASELSTSKTVQDVCDLICENLPSKSKLESHLNLIHVVGNTGSGRTTFCQAVLKELIRNRSVKESEIIYIKINKHDNVDCVWNYGIQLAQELRNMGSVTSVLSLQSSSQQEKKEAMVSIFNSFGVVSFDNLSLSESNHQLFTLLMSIVHKLKNSVIHISNKETPPPNHAITVQVHGFNHAAIRSNLNWKVAIQYLDANYKPINETVCINPLAVHFLLNASQIFGVLEYEGVKTQTPVSDVLNMIWLHLSEHEKLVLFQLSQLRRALPLEKAEDLLRIIQIGLVEYESPGLYGNLFGQVTLNDSVKDFVLARAESEMPLNKTDSNFDVFDCWKMLLCEELIGLIDEARNNAWPFVPEKWQYVKNVGQEESYNVKDLINMKVKNLPHLTQFDVLQETLHHAILKKDYESMAAILFIIDRYIYWQGGSKILLDIVDSIMKEKPELPIAPQIIIRKARVLRTSGDLQGAEKVLDKLLNEKQKLGTWHYKEEHHHDLVKAVCVQIKGEIQATLGHWYDSAVLLLDSIRLFKELPKVDKKGLSSSLGLCAKTLQHMSVEEFKIIAQRYFLKESHPYIQAYEFAFEAAEFAIYTPIFYARHKQSAGQMLLEYSKISVDKSKHLNGALKELKESLAAHNEYDALKSREQYHIFIIALYKISCVMEDMQLKKHLDLKITSMALFYHYSCNKTSIVHDSNSKVLINRALTILELPLFVEEMNPSETTGLSAPVAVGEINIKPAQTSLVDRCAGTLQALTLGQSLASTVDRSKTTVLTIDDLTGSDMTNYYDYLNESINILKSDNVHECKVSSYDAVKLKWKDQNTIIYIGEQLNLSKDDEGAQRNPYMVEYLGQDEPMGKYVGKRYKGPLGPQQYKEDVRCQMTARYYVGLFNQDLYHKGIEVSHIQFLPVVMVTLLTPNAGETSPVVYNVEPYMQGKFIKLTNNWAFVEEDVAGSQLVLAFSHFTYERSNKTLLITDHQGWTSEDHLSTTFLTDPQIHSVDKKLYGTGNLGMRGINKFWKSMHPECNEICKKLGLTRPS